MAGYTKRAYKGAAVATTLSASMSNVATSCTIAAYTGWPSGSDPFYVVISPGTAAEEKVLVTRTGATDTTLNVVTSGRGVDDTSAQSHDSGATIYPVFTAVDAAEANTVASTLTTKGDLLAHTGSAHARLAAGTNDYVLTAASGETAGLKWVAPNYGLRQIVTFTSSGTFSKASYPWLRAIRVQLIGAGGGGGGCDATGASQCAVGGGGGGGGYVLGLVTDIAGLSASETMTVGSGGAGGNNATGATGGSTTAFGWTAEGGDGGANGAVAAALTAYGNGGIGGNVSGSGYTWGLRGSTGTAGFSLATNRLFPGGTGFPAVVPPGSRIVLSATSGNGGTSTKAGLGGTGARNTASDATARTGGGGANGIIILELYA